MASTFENDLRLEEIGTGEKSGTWGVTTNTNLELIGDAFGYAPKVLANAATDTLTVPDGTAINAEARAMYIRYSGGNQDCTVTIGPNTLSKVWFIHNGTSHTITFSQGSGANVAVAAGKLKAIATDGGGSVAKVYDITQNISIPDLFVDNTLTVAGNTDLAAVEFNSLSGTGSVTITDILDEDNMASNSPTKLSTQQSIKAYVDSQVATSDTLTEVLANGNTTATDQKIQFRDSAIYINSSVDGQLDIVADTEIQLTAPTVDLNGNLNVSGTVDGVDIAARDAVLTSTTTTANAALPKAGGAMTGAITTNSTFDGRDVATDGTKLDGIEASADVTDTTNVTAAGALMDSEVTNLAQVKAFDSADYATAAQGTTADAALPKAGGAMTGAITTNSTFDGRDVATDGTKLDGIEASADVTDTANVTAAGALMDSEVDADIKTLSLPANTTISAYGKTIIDDANASAARTTLGVAIGSNVQAYSSVLQNTTASFTTADETKLDYITVTQAVSLDQMEIDIAALENGMVYKGDWNAGSGSFPGGGSAQTGWFYYVSGAGTVNGISFTVGDNIVATTDNASTSTYANNWSKHDQTDAVQAVVGLTGSITKSGLLSALNVEDGADVTDTTNVTAAGALMDSEVDADIKTLSLPANTTISAYGKTLVDDADAATARTTLGLGTAATTAASAYATAAQGTTADAALPKAGGTMTGDLTVPNLITSGNVDGRDIATNIPASLGTAGQVLTVNSGATAGEWADAGGGADLYAANESSPTAQPSATGTNSIAIGDSAISTGTNSFAGPLSRAQNSNTVALGINSNSSSYGALGNYSVAIGYQAKAANSWAISIGRDAISTQNESFAVGKSLASGDTSFAAQITNNTTSYGASGANSVAIGKLAKATHEKSVGIRAQATGNYAVAIGDGTVASGSASVALGRTNNASATYSAAIGSNCSIQGFGSIGIGRENTINSSHESSLVLGAGIQSTASNQVSIGGTTQDVRISEVYTLPKVDGSANQTLTTNGSGVVSWATAAGGADLYAANESSPSAQPSATGTNAIAIGDGAISTNTNSFAGPLSRAGGTNSFAMGIGNNGTSYGTVGNAHGIAMGQYAKAQGNYDIAIGRSATASGENDSIAIGRSTTANSGYAVAIGYSNLASGSYSIAMGYDTTASAANATAIGSASNYTSKSNASGEGSVAIGGGTATATDSMALGDSRASGTDSFAAQITNNTTTYGASGNNTIAIGYQAKATSGYGGAIGYKAVSTHSTAVAIGRDATTTASNQVAVGGSGKPVRISGTYTLPIADGSNGQVMTTNGSGTVTFADAGGGGADLYAANESSPTAQPSATGTNAIAIGDSATATAAHDVAIGLNANATAQSNSPSLAMGKDADASSGGISIGNYGSATGTYATALGTSANATATNASALGNDAKSTASDAVALGKSRASGSYSVAAGIGTNSASYGATASYSVALGSLAKATGQSSVCLSNTGVASSSNSAVLGGSSGTASGTGAVALGGSSNVADAVYSTAKGYYGNANGIRLKHATGVYPNQQGAYYVLGYSTTDATPIALNTSVWTPSATNQITLPNNSAYTFSGTVVAREKASEGTDVGAWEIKGIIRREANAGTTVLVNSVINELNVPTGWAIALTADTTNGCLKVEATGVASTNIRWVATINTSEVIYA